LGDEAGTAVAALHYSVGRDASGTSVTFWRRSNASNQVSVERKSETREHSLDGDLDHLENLTKSPYIYAIQAKSDGAD
jgi:hypothetical protein